MMELVIYDSKGNVVSRIDLLSESFEYNLQNNDVADSGS